MWEIQTSKGDVEAKFCIMATGCLSAPNIPDFEGLDDYKGQLLHTGKWPQTPVDFTDETVAIIGTGSSSIQSITVIAKPVSYTHLTLPTNREV